MPRCVPATLEIHIAKMIFVTHDIGEKDVAIFVGHQSDRDTSDGIFIARRVHQTQRSATNCCIELEPFDSGSLRSNVYVYGNFSGGGNDRHQASLREVTVADFASAWAANGSAFTNAERREVVVEHELLG